MSNSYYQGLLDKAYQNARKRDNSPPHSDAWSAYDDAHNALLDLMCSTPEGLAYYHANKDY